MTHTLTRYQVPGRLADVLALIQALGQTDNKTGQITNEALLGDGVRPSDSASWVEVAKQHPEFFRVSGKGENAIMLVCQFTTKAKPTEEKLEKLMDLAQTTNDREVIQHQKAYERELESRKLGLSKLSLILSAVTAIGSMIVAIVALLAK